MSDYTTTRVVNKDLNEVEEAIALYLKSGTDYIYNVLIPMADAMLEIQNDDPKNPSEAAFEAANRFGMDVSVIYGLRMAYQKGCVALQVADWFRAREAEYNKVD